VAFVLVAVVVIAAAVCAVLARARAAAQGEAAEARAERDRLAAQLTAVVSERDELRGQHESTAAANARVTADAERQRERADDLAARLEAATRAPAAGGGGDDDGLWRLLLAHVARRWGSVVGVPPEGRSVVDGPASAQLAEALSREVERLREEVGVDVDLVHVDPAEPVSAEAGGRLGDDPADRVPVLLAAVELLGVLAASCQQVTVEVGDTVTLVGEGRLDAGDELAAVRDRAAAAGVAVGPLVADDEADRVEVALHPAARTLAG
jgi:hypothetical protein